MLLLLLHSAVAIAQHADVRPRFQPFRFDEDWRSVADASSGGHGDWLDSLKYIGLGVDGWYATLAGEARERYELLDHPNFGAGPTDTNGYFLQRYLLSADVHLGPRFRVFGELQSGLENGRAGGPRPTDADVLDVHQAFVDWRMSAGGSDSVVLRVGRQELGFGSGRLISPAEGLNLRRSLDGVRLIVTRGRWVWNATALRLVRSNAGFFDDTPDHTQSYWGAGVVGPIPLWRGNVAVHYHGLDRKSAVFEKGVGRAIRHTAGVRTWRGAEPSSKRQWDFNYEGFVQWGSFRGAPIRAWALAEDTGYTFAGVRSAPRVGLRADVASGDGGVSKRALGSFDPLFPAAPVYSGPSGLLGPTNLIDLSPSVRLRLNAATTLTVESSSFWRESLADGIYGPSVIPVRLAGASRARYVATAASGTLAWTMGRHLTTSLIYTRFVTGRFFREALPDRNVNYVATTVSYRF